MGQGWMEKGFGMNITFIAFKSGRTRRGSILFMTAAVLAVLGVIATTIMFSTRIETKVSANAGKAVQDRMTAVSSISNVIDYVQPLSGAVPTSFTLVQQDTMRRAFHGSGLALDQSGLMNINTFDFHDVGLNDLPENGKAPVRTAERARSGKADLDTFDISEKRSKAFRAFLGQRIQEAGVPASQASSVAHNIAAWRHSGQKSPGGAAVIASKSDAKFKAQNESESSTQTLRFEQLEDLMDVPGVTPEIYSAIAPWLTVDSSSLDIWFDPDGHPYARAPLNELDALQIYTLLKTCYPAKDENILRQMAVNIVDRRDTDNIPTVFPDMVGSLPIIGFEYGLVISEVCPDVLTLDADDDNGEYIELFNPLDKAVDLSGYTVSWASSGASQGQLMLSGKLEPGAHLIITDDLKDDLDPTPEYNNSEMGCFYDVFKVLPLGKDRIIESFSMDIPNSRGTIALTDPDGNLIDYIVYDAGAFNGINRGFEKTNLFVHTTSAATATPFRNTLSPPAGNEHEVACWLWTRQRMNQPFISAGELLTIPQMYTPAASLEPAEVPAYPAFAGSRSDKGLDARLLDIFTLQDRPLDIVFDDKGELVVVYFQTNRKGRAKTQDDGLVLAPVRQGLINMNTSPVEVLQLVPGIDASLAEHIVSLRQKSSEPLVLKSLSDLISTESVWEGRKASDRLHSLIYCAPSVSFMSSSWYVQSTKAGHTVTALVNFSPLGGLDVLDWKYE